MRSWNIQHQSLSKVDSTNEWCKQHAFPKNLNDVIIVQADSQTAGRGMHGKIWVSPAGCNIYQSYCFLLPNLKNVVHIPQILCLSLLHVLQGYDIPPRIKWPNDVFVEGKKIAGVLCEIYDNRCVIGIGINVNMKQEQLDAVPQPATSLKGFLGHDVSLNEVKAALDERFLEDLSVLLEKGFAPFYNDYLSNMLYINQIVSWTLGEETKIGRLKGIDPQGRLVLFLEDTETDIIVHSGQIRLVDSYNF